MQTRALVLLATLGLIAGMAVGTYVGDPAPGSPGEDGRGDGDGLTTDPKIPDGGSSETERFRLEPDRPYRVEITAGSAAGNLTVDVDAEQVEGGLFGLIARPLGEGAGMAKRASLVHASVSSPDTNGTFVFFARSDRPVDVELTFPTSNFQTDGQLLEPVRRSEMVSLSGSGTQAQIETSGYDLVIEVSNQGAGTLQLVDPEGDQRASASAGGSAWALVDPRGTWTLTCSDLCAGQAQVTVTGYPG